MSDWHANGSTQYCHDRFGQVTRKVQTINGVASALRYAYSKAGRLASLTYPDGSVADYVRDTLGRISQIGLTRPGQARQVVVNGVTYAAFGPATGWAYGNGRQLQRPLDLDYRPQAVHDPATGGLSLRFGYDAVGSITELKNGTGSAVLAKYAYDTLGRLTQTQDGATGTPIETYAYDATGNRTALTTSAGIVSYTYPATSHRLTAVDGEARSHDAAGNTTSIGSKAFTYNDANRMNAVRQGNAALESYGYNHRGERVLRAPEGGNAQITVYDEAGQWLGNYSITGVAQQQAIWLDSYPVALINVPSTGVPELAYIQPDHLGTPRVVIDPVRDVAIWEWSNKSEVFGDQAPANDPDGDGVAFDLALRFPGQQATEASGLFFNYHREYEPNVGRYFQSDPIGLSGGINTYLYTGAGPVARIDPLGLDYLIVGGGVREGSLNFFGHVGIAISDNGMYSYGNDTPLGSSPVEYLRSQSEVRNQTVVLVPATPQQSLASAQYLSRAHPGMNSVGFFDNCAVRSNEGLMAGGMSTLQSPFPGGMTRAASRLPGARTFYIPKGGDIPKELLDALPAYEKKAVMSGGNR